jgi:hypothetical protein
MILPQPTQKFLMTADIREDTCYDLPQRPVSPHHQISIQESQKNIQEENARLEKLAFLEIDPLYDYRQTLEYKLKLMEDQMQEIEKKHNEIETDLSQEGKHLEEVYQTQQNEMSKMKKEAALKYINSIESYIEDKIEPLESEEQTAKLLAANKELYAQIDLLMSKKLAAQKITEEPSKISISQPSIQRSSRTELKPTVMKRPQNLMRRPQNVKGMVNKRMSEVYKLTEEVIRLAQKHRDTSRGR